jgi:1-acyl-sn-glycerol-3-phosphate acyltransferase
VTDAPHYAKSPMMNWDQTSSSSYGSAPLATLRLVGFLAMILILVPAQVFYAAFRPGDRHCLPLVFHRWLLKLIGFRVRVHGAMATSPPVFFVANHASYLDVPVLGALIPASFVAKAEVAAWPLFGFLARLQGTVFIERRKTRAGQQRTELMAHLAQRRSLIIFPEGTSSDGRMVLPFKSSLFGAIENAAEDIAILVQPVSIACTEIDGLPISQALRPFYAWYGDMTLIPHLWQAFKCGHFTVDVIFHPPVNVRDFPNRKALSAVCRRAIAQGVEQCVTGRRASAEPESARLMAPA